MKGAWDFIKTSLFTGFVVLLPIGLLVLILVWLYRIINGIVEPLAAVHSTPTLVTKGIVLALLVFVVFAVGACTRTRPGKFLFDGLERYVFSYIPGYKFLKLLIKPFVGGEFKENFESVALVDVYGNDALVTAFITERQENGYITVFVPTGPNVTTGLIFHVPKERVKPVKAQIDDVLGSVFALGAGSHILFKKMK